MVLRPLEFKDCLTDSLVFRQNLEQHEKELERTSKAIKSMINDGKELLAATRPGALLEFGKLMGRIEDERERMLGTLEQFIEPLEKFRKTHILAAKEGKKQFDKQTQKFCSSLERYLGLKTKINDNTFKEADAQLDMERRGFNQASMQYVLTLQEVQERKKFEFVEIVLRFMCSLLTFYHEGYETAGDYKDYLNDLQWTIQKTRENFDSTREQAQDLMLRMLENRGMTQYLSQAALKSLEQSGILRGTWSREGYLYLMEKKMALGVTWTKYWCCYNKDNKNFYMIPFNQTAGMGKISMSTMGETLKLTSCIRRATDSIDRRFCFDATFEDKQSTMTFQALSEEDRKLWLEALDGKEPVYIRPRSISEETCLDDTGFQFVKKCLTAIESKGLDEQGLYRVVGVNSKVNKLIAAGLDKKKGDKLSLDEYEIKTVTSAVKNYLRSLPEPLMTFRFHSDFITAAKQEDKIKRIHDIHTLVRQLPASHREMLEVIIRHLRRVADNSQKNLMPVANIGVCFGPTLMRPEEETMESIMDIKFCNIVIEILINHCKQIFEENPDEAVYGTSAELASTIPPSSKAKHSPQPTYSKVTDWQQGMQDSKPIYENRANLPFAEARLSQVSLRFDEAGTSKASLPFAEARAKLRPVDAHNTTSTGGYDNQSYNSTSGSSESLQSSQSNHVYSPKLYSSIGGLAFPRKGSNQYSNSSALDMANRLISSTSDVPTFDPELSTIAKETYETSAVTSTPVSMTGSVTGTLESNSNNSSQRVKRRTVRALYRCVAENESELSFDINTIIQNVRDSKEPGWLEGTINGKTGLIPQNYVEYID
ncbi:hypothetical protein CHS0354_024907 [Potamilus streckersoni]|uniref:Rho GTPase-activating protein 26 n=1 Tax=Potamilus streckersoni TaxID=2493646 RepID=A0AAE0VY68_9BIVA|nr:hypothetical protein CHS0354_024907 [Potamilus streckersoni]